MEMTRVTSSAIDAIGYEPSTMRLFIRFLNSGTYTFCRVPPEIFAEFIQASSKGGFYRSYIRDRFHC